MVKWSWLNLTRKQKKNGMIAAISLEKAPL